MKRCYILCLLCVVLTSACAQKINYRSFKHYNEMVDAFAGLPTVTSNEIVMLGDSHTEFGGDWNTYFDGVNNIRNYGIAGDNAIGIRHRLCQISKNNPKAIFFECGINDLSHNLTPEQVASDVFETLDTLHALCPETPLYVQGVFPINMDVRLWKTLDGRTDDVPVLNNLLKEGCKERGFVFIDVFSVLKEPFSNKLRRNLCRDGLHLTPAGYKIWAKTIEPYILLEVRGER